MKRLIKIVLIAFLILSNFSISPVMAKESESNSFEKNEDSVEEYKIYSERENEKTSIYPDNTNEEVFYELKDNTSVLVKKLDLETSLKKNDTYVFVTLNLEVEEIPEGLEETYESVDEIQGFVHKDHLIALEDEEEFLLERKTKNEDSEEETTNDSEESVEEEIEDETLEEPVEEIDETESNKEEKAEDFETPVKEEPTEEESKETEEKVTKEPNETNEPVKEEKGKKEKITKDENKTNTFSMMRNAPKETKTSRLGHIRGGNRLIYETIGGKSTKASAKHRDAVYYIKRQAKVGSQTYYLLSNSPSATKGVVGWMKSGDVSTHTHAGVTKTSKRLALKGTGQATSKAWGGNKDQVHASMSRFKGQSLDVNLTEKVGNNTWYRGKINGTGANVWLHSSQTEKLQIKESNTSRLGHVRGGNRLIYEKLDGRSFKASTKYQNKVYYIKRQAKVGSQTYYLLSNSPSATKGVVGWMKSGDVSIHPHAGVTKTPKRLALKGTGQATSKAWGGSKDRVHASMSRFKGQPFDVNLTEKVGKNTWYRGKINGTGTNVWLHSSQTEKLQIKEFNTSRLGHARGGNRLIYKKLDGGSFKASAKYQNKVYYIKRQAKIGSQTYYLLSNSPSATKGVVGWMKSGDVSTHTHAGVTKTSKRLALKGTGQATSKAWGGDKDRVHASMSRFKGQSFDVNLTEKIGKNTWYRGKISGTGANVWLHSSQTEKLKFKETSTSRLGHIRGGERLIYKTLDGKHFKASAKHRDTVYYIKREAKMNSETYYLLSNSPSTTKGVLGWVKSKDLSTHTHKGVTKKSKQLIIKGTGQGMSKAWGGSKDRVHASMSSFKGKAFHVNLTEKVGKNTWYRGKINGKGKNVWLHSSQTKGSKPLIVLDAGHGGGDPGASGNGLVEKDIALDVTLRTEKILKARGYNVILTRRTDVFIELKERSNIANRNNASSFLSIHANSGGGIGTETWWYNKNNAASSKKFAQAIQNGVIKKTNARNRGIKNGNLSINRESKMTSALLEVGFVDSMTDAQKLKKTAYRNQIAIGAADGFDNYYK